MIWVTWRQHRSQAITCLALFAALAVYAIMIGISMRTAFGQRRPGRLPGAQPGTGCPAVITSFVDQFGHGVNSRSGTCC